MLSRIQKQIVIGGVFGVFLFGVVAIIITLLPLRKEVVEATCFDGIQNQNEEGTDCGGACISCKAAAERLLQDIIIYWAQAFPVKQGLYDFAAYIENPNFSYGGEEIVYRFVAYDMDGREVGSFDGMTFILPHEKKYIIAPQSGGLDRTPASTTFDIQSIAWQKLTNFSDPGLYVEERLFATQPDAPGTYAQGSGTVVNGSPYNVRSIEVAFIAFDSSGNPLAVNRSEIETVRSKERRFVKVVWPQSFAGVVDDFSVWAYSNFFANENFLSSHGTSQRFQEYYIND